MLVLIGGNGFIGRHLTILADSRNVPVTVVDVTQDHEFLSAHAPGAKSMSVDDFEKEKGESLIRRADAIVYLASKSVPASFLAEPWREVSENVQPAFRTFTRISEINPSAKIIFPSSGGGGVWHSQFRQYCGNRPFVTYLTLWSWEGDDRKSAGISWGHTFTKSGDFAYIQSNWTMAS